MSNLIPWLQDRFSKIYDISLLQNEGGPTGLEDFSAGFDAVFASNIRITINGEEVSRDGLKERIISSASAATHIQVEWKDLIEVPNQGIDDSDLVTGMVAGQFIITRSLKFRIRAAPAQNQTITIFQARIENDANISSGDLRRITQLHYTMLSKPVPIHV
ncbi:hypothetical protein PC9H_004470 [Pleurotus ostreatus]|uniref:Uncharacterized protein n=1 Tax=Pleurotus ostreatus TaxID=5322 RepID=A0A8H6ZY07_PLEOS|nr:uncharacterized protein PC9H_004470 [Pleurotus ostreatus]KAF7432529.1 hypothetical protein PC9H_004470 [Pleurotus ostreatus]KAJ8698994.1 hypothetical protein PTI98_005635 [Pleurotus ostreatus]